MCFSNLFKNGGSCSSICFLSTNTITLKLSLTNVKVSDSPK